MSNNLKQKGLQPRILEEEDKGNVDPRIYFIKRCGPEGKTLYLWPWEYEARIQYAKAKGLQKKLDELEAASGKKDDESETEKAQDLLKQLRIVQGTLDKIQSDVQDKDFKKDAIIQAKDEALKNVNASLKEKDKKIAELEESLQNSREILLDKQKRLDSQNKKLADKKQVEEENKSLKKQLESQKAENEKLKGKAGLGEGQAQQIMDLKGEIRDLEAKLRNYIRKYGELF
jgi:DNA repair exonuclease SbcCD ATPase subunit